MRKIYLFSMKWNAAGTQSERRAFRSKLECHSVCVPIPKKSGHSNSVFQNSGTLSLMLCQFLSGFDVFWSFWNQWVKIFKSRYPYWTYLMTSDFRPLLLWGQKSDQVSRILHALQLFIAMKFTILLALCSVATSTDLPKDLSDPVLFCEGCYGTMYEIDGMMIQLKHLRLKQRVGKALAEVCDYDKLDKYVFSPPKMSKVSQ